MNAPLNDQRIGHSADVRIHLHLNGQVLPIEQLGPDFFVLRQPFNHPPTDAELSTSIDGNEDRWPVHLINGIQAEQRKTSITRSANLSN